MVEMPKNHRLRPLLLLAVLAAAVGCGGEAAPTTPDGSDAGGAAHAGAGTGGAAGIANFAWISDRIARGAQPERDADFQALASAGIKTIISVDGAKPDVEAATAHGMRYVHIPIGYDGVPAEQRRELAKTVRELSGPFFVHCHHGKHRGPAGAVLAQMVLGGMSNEEAVAELRRAGTAEKYSGLYEAALEFCAPTEEETRALDFDFPEVAPVPELAAAMATIDRRFDSLKLVRKAGWGAVEEHPDLDPAHEALQVLELFTEASRLDGEADRPAPFGELIQGAIGASRDLEGALRASPPDLEAAEGAFRKLSRSCSECHTSFRNTAGR